MEKSPHLFGVFPYLCTDRTVAVQGITLLSSDDLADVTPEIRERLDTLCAMFFAGDGVQIKRMTCCHVWLHDESHFRQMMMQLYEIRLLLGYLYSSPSHTGDVFLSSESSSLFAFRPGQVASSLVRNSHTEGDRTRLLIECDEPKLGFLEGYEGIRNMTGHLWVARGSRIYPELHHQTLNYSQYIARNLAEFLAHAHNWAFRHLYLGQRRPQESTDELHPRIYNGLEWYLKSCRGAISESEALVHLAIAIESLMKVPSGKDLTERFKDAVLTLIGPVPRLDSWLEQFYLARSKAVHEGVPHELMFLAVDKEHAKKARRGEKDVFLHRSLIEYGRRIFRLCLNNIISAAANVSAIDLDKLFVHNAERLLAIRKILSDKKLSQGQRLSKADGPIGELLRFQDIWFEPQVEFADVLHVMRDLLKVFTEANPTLSDDARQAIQGFLSDNSKKQRNSEQFAAMDAIHHALQNIQGTRTGQHLVVMTFLQFATASPFRLRCLFEDHPKS
jgi:hypothetical protein